MRVEMILRMLHVDEVGAQSPRLEKPPKAPQSFQQPAGVCGRTIPVERP
jgi:hypothetical protein